MGNDTYRVTGFEIEPLSIAEGENRLNPTIKLGVDLPKQPLKNDTQITFTYSLTTKIVPWSHRVDHYKKITSHFGNLLHGEILFILMCMAIFSVACIYVIQC